jgi:hypothetical protein
MLLLTGCPLTKVTFVPQFIAICNISPNKFLQLMSFMLPHRMTVEGTEARSWLLLSPKELQERLLDIFMWLLNCFLRLFLTATPSNYEQSRYCSSGNNPVAGLAVLSAAFKAGLSDLCPGMNC